MRKKGIGIILCIILVFTLASCGDEEIVEIITEDEFVKNYEMENQIKVLERILEGESLLLLYEKDDQHVIDYFSKFTSENISSSKYSWDIEADKSVEIRCFGNEITDYVIFIFNDEDIYTRCKKISISLGDISFEYEMDHIKKRIFVEFPERPRLLKIPEVTLYDIEGLIIEQ